MTIKTARPPSQTTSRPFRRTIMLGTPLAFAALSLLHPLDFPTGPGDAAIRGIILHAGQLPLSVLLAYGIWFMLDGLTTRAAGIARAALPVFLVSFTAFDSVTGLATCWLAQTSNEIAGGPAAANSAITLLANNWLAGNLSVAGSVTAIAWLLIAVTAAIALRRGGADKVTVAFMGSSALFLNHPPPTGTVGMLALAVAAYRWDRLRQQAAVAGQGAHESDRGPRA